MKSLNRIINKVFNEPWKLPFSELQSMARQLEMVLEGKQQLPSSAVMDAVKAQTPVSNLPSIGVIPVFGIIGNHLSQLEMDCGGCSLNQIQALAKQYMNDDTVSQVAMYIDSPGGGVIGLPETYNVLKQLAAVKPLTAYTDNLCCSAAMELASAATNKYASPSARVGAIGTYALYLDESEALRMQGIKINAIAAGTYKLLGQSFQPMTPEEKALLTANIVEINDAFKQVILAGAPNLLEQDKSLEGMVYSGANAVAINMFDGNLDTFDDYIAFIQ